MTTINNTKIGDVSISQAIKFLEVTTLKRFAFLSLSALLLIILIPGCTTVQTPAPAAIPLAVQPSVIGSFSNTPSTISPGGTSTLSWNVSGANSVSIDNGIGLVNATGNMAVSPATSTVYTISATNAAGTVTKTAMTTVSVPVPFSVTGVVASTNPNNFTGVCPKTFVFNADITASGPGTVTYIWESLNGEYYDKSAVQSVTFDTAGTKTTTLQWDLKASAEGLHRVHILTPNDVMSIPVYYELNCGTGSLVTGIVVGVNQYPFSGACPKAINFWATITANGPGTVTYRWDRSDSASVTTSTAIESITFTEAGSKTITNTWTRGAGTAWQLLHVLTPDDAVSSQIDFVLTCD